MMMMMMMMINTNEGEGKGDNNDKDEQKLPHVCCTKVYGCGIPLHPFNCPDLLLILWMGPHSLTGHSMEVSIVHAALPIEQC